MKLKIVMSIAVFATLFSACQQRKSAQSTGGSKLAALEAEKSAKGWTFDMAESEFSQMLDQKKMAYPSGIDRSKRKEVYLSGEALFTYLDSDTAKRPLPAKWDWRDYDVVTEVRNQGMCGSCWAFGSVAAMESAVMVQTGRRGLHISEQELVSCSGKGTCGGGYFALDHFVESGAVYNDDFPYQAQDVMCRQSAPKREKAAQWALVGSGGGNGGYGNSEPTIEELKRAIYDFGPITTVVAVSDSWQFYRGGVYNACDSNNINHMVAIVGWDDADQTWIVKNSHGKTWGENGFMRTKWTDAGGRKCNSIGSDAAYVVFDPTKK